MSSNNLSEQSNVFQDGIENLMAVEEQIRNFSGKDTNCAADEDFRKDEFWEKIKNASKKLSFECTKLCIAFVNPPLPPPQEASGLVCEVQRALIYLMSIFYTFPVIEGKVLLSELKLHCIEAVQSTRTLLKIIKDEGGEGVDGRYRQSTGVVWQGCNHLQTMPTDNKTAVLVSLKKQKTMVTDAVDEITEAMKGDGSGWDCFDDEDMEEDSPSWSKEDKDIMNPIIYVIKSAKMLCKRVEDALNKNGNTNNPNNISDLDQIYLDCEPLSKTIDLIIMDLYPPLSINSVRERITEFAGLIRTALKTFAQSHLCTEDEQKQVEFIRKAVDHNMEKFREKVEENV